MADERLDWRIIITLPIDTIPYPSRAEGAVLVEVI
jgi:hypothetical protein